MNPTPLQESENTVSEAAGAVRETAAEQAQDADTLSNQAYRRIEEMIVTLELAPGRRVSEKSLSRLLGIGRTPIREALQKLAAEGTVRIQPRSGVVVSDIDVADQFNALEVRRELERLIAGRAARLATAAERQQFTQLADAFEHGARTDDVNIFIPTDREFNRMVVTTARNEHATRAIQVLQAQTRRFWYLNFKRVGDLPRVCRLHAAVARAIAAGDEPAARAKSDALMDYVDEYTRETVRALS